MCWSGAPSAPTLNDIDAELIDVSSKSADTRAAAEAKLDAFIERVKGLDGDEENQDNAAWCRTTVTSLLAKLGGAGAAAPAPPSWQLRVFACRAFSALCQRFPRVICDQLPSVVPALTPLVWEAKLAVSERALEALEQLYNTIQNNDVVPFIPTLFAALKAPKEITETIHKLSSIVFVQQVRAPELSIFVPLLIRGFAERHTATQRKCAVIAENMCKLVDDPEDVRVFLPQLAPAVDKVMREVADPECRGVVTRVAATLKYMEDAVRAGGERGAGDEDEAGEDLCDCEFSLAYGTLILLNKTRLRLKKGGRYGICGKNGCGKSTLMRAIANDQVSGFPTRDVLRRVYVEHDISGSEAETTALDFIANDPEVSQLSYHDCRGSATAAEALAAVGFTPALQATPVGALSGGWKMKLALCRAMLLKPDILLLDEPTNHLDVANVAWLQEYLVRVGAAGVTCLIVSHDSGFLDAVCTHIVHYDRLKLRTYRGNLAAFVEALPEAKTYYELAATPEVFKLAEPGFLEGVKTKDKAIVKMTNARFAYPGTDRSILSGVSASISLSSRVGCIGANGAGKSTLIKLLTGELEPTEGVVWKHPNLRIAYVAQHAFHHIEKHLDMTANEYIRWRYATGEDREAEEKVSRKISEEERLRLEAKFLGGPGGGGAGGAGGSSGGPKRQFHSIVGRRKLKKSYEYEVRWKFASSGEPMSDDMNTWIERDDIIALGLEKYVNECDMKEAAALGLMAKPLTQANVEAHLTNLGLLPEIATHNRIRGYSGGQKVRLVIGAATWMNPHVIILDEPSNYLDRDSLGALAAALKDYGGGVVIISHSREFLASVGCTTTWSVADEGVCIEGEGALGAGTGAGTGAGAGLGSIGMGRTAEVTDAYGNTIQVKGPKKANLSNKERKALAKARKARRERGEVVTDDSDEDA